MTQNVSAGFGRRTANSPSDPRTANGGNGGGGSERRHTSKSASVAFALELKRRQTAEVYHAMPTTMALSLLGTILTFLMLYSTGDGERGVVWLAFAIGVLFFRGIVIWHYSHVRFINDPDKWAWLFILGNFLAGIQWGFLGTWLYVADPIFRALFSLIAIMGFVGGSVVPYSPIRFAHAALALPAAFPAAVYVFFMRADGNWIAGCISMLMMGSIIYMAELQYEIIRARLLSEMENEQFRREAEQNTTSLGADLQKLEHRAVVVKRAQVEAKRRAETLACHMESTLLPVIECDQRGQIIEWNAAAERAFGYRHSELAETTLNSMVSPVEPNANWTTFFDTTLNLKQPGALDVFVRTNDGRPMPARLYVTPIDIDGDTGKKAGRAAIIVTNIPTEISQRRAEKSVSNGN